MLSTFKTTLSAAMISSIALGSAATVTIVMTPDEAYAQSAKGQEKGKGRNDRSAKTKTKGKSGEKLASRGRGGQGLGGLKKDLRSVGRDAKGLLNKLRGRETRKAHAGWSKDTIHPRYLGNMNGALHANENAIAAHIRNGNTNGPVGLMADYVSGRATTAATLETLGGNAVQYAELNDLLVENGYVDENGDPDLNAYLDSGDVNDEIYASLEEITRSDQQDLLVENGFVDANGDPDLQAYLDSGEVIPEIDAASTDANVFDEAFYNDVTAARDDLSAERDAEQALVDYWNKGDSAPEGTEDELRAALDERAMELEATDSVMNALQTEDTLAANCSEATGGCDPAGDDLSVIE